MVFKRLQDKESLVKLENSRLTLIAKGHFKNQKNHLTINNNHVSKGTYPVNDLVVKSVLVDNLD